MAKCVFESDDLLRTIYGFGDVGHRERMNRIVIETGIEDIIRDYIYSDYCERTSSAFVFFLKDCFDQEERDDMMVRLKRCHCCSRHSHYKDISRKPAVPVPESALIVDQCFCNCRHYTRLFKRHNLA